MLAPHGVASQTISMMKSDFDYLLFQIETSQGVDYLQLLMRSVEYKYLLYFLAIKRMRLYLHRKKTCA